MRNLILVMFFLVSSPSFAGPLSAADKIIAVKYLSSKSFPEMTKLCSETNPNKAELFHATLHDWSVANEEAIFKGEEIFHALMRSEGRENVEEVVRTFVEVAQDDFSNLSNSQKINRCDYFLEVMRTEQ